MNAVVLEILAKSEVVSNISWVTQNFSIDLYLCDFRSIFGENSAYMWNNNWVWLISPKIATITLREKCSGTEFFLVRMFPLSDWIQRDTSYLSVFSLNAGKYGPKKLRFWTFFTQVQLNEDSWKTKIFRTNHYITAQNIKFFVSEFFLMNVNKSAENCGFVHIY